MSELNVIQQIGLFLIETLFTLYIAAVVIRILLGIARASFNNPLSQMIIKITNPVIVPLRRVLPAVGKIDSAAIALAFILMLVKLSLSSLIAGHLNVSPALLWFTLGELIKLTIWIYIIALIVQAVISWVGNGYDNPVAGLFNSMTRPILKPVQRVLPTMGMMDFSPLVAIIGLNILLIIVDNIF